MSVSSGVSDGAEDRVDAFVLSSVMSSVVGSVPHARPGAREFSLGGVLWKTVMYALTYVAGFACGWFLLFDQDQDWVRIVGGDGGVVRGAVLDAGQGDGVCWRVLVLVLRGGRRRRLVVRAGYVGDREVREHTS